MTSQGWTPGEYLGAKDAAHAEFHTSANASHIRVVVKDDNLGLGAKRGSGQGEGECTGLDVFQMLLGRLNGNEAEIEAEQKKKEDLRNAIYAERKWGSIRFVSGGFLVGDKIQDLINNEAERVKNLKIADKADSSSDSSSSEDEQVNEKAKDKKRKAEDEPEVDDSERARRKEKKAKKSKDKSEKKEKKSKKKSKSSSDSDSESEPSEVKTKKEKKEKKDKKEKRSKKEKKSKSSDDSESEERAKDKSKKRKKSKSEETSGTSTPKSPVPQMLQGRHAVRARNIAQKRLAVMDMTQLNQVRQHPTRDLKCALTDPMQIFMVKS
jgi:Pin2-interacting protein X1